MAEESQYCNSRELYEARMKNEELRRQHKDTCQCSCPGAARRETGGDRLQQRVWAGSPARGLQWETFRFHGIEETINEFDGSDRRQIEVVAETHEFPLLHSPSSFGCGWLTIPEIPDYGKGYIKSWHLEIPLLLLSYWCQCMLHDGPCKSYPFHLPLRGKRSQGHGGSEHQDWHLETAINTYSDTYSDLALVVK